MKRFLTSILAVLAIAACETPDNPNGPTDDSQNPSAPSKVQIEPVITRATEVNFEDGDKIGLTIIKTGETAAYATNELLTYAGSVFTGDLMWYDDAQTTANVYAYYPYDAAGVPSKFSVETDQTAGMGKSDFMAAAKADVLPSANAVSMVFRHYMTKLVIAVDNQSGKEVSDVVIKNSIPTATVNVATLQVAADASAAAADIRAYKVKDAEYAAIVVPQTVAFTIAVTVGDKVIEQPLASMDLKAGGQYSANVSVLADEIKVVFKGEIENWTIEDVIANEGTTEEGEYVEHGGVKYKTVTLADGKTWMAENLRYVPEGKTVSSDATADAGIWYPAANANKTADPALVEKLGLLYDAATAFGVESITEENAASFENVQGICPDGWHIPSAKDLIGLVGHCSNAALVDDGAPYYDASIKGASIAGLRDAGWEWSFAGVRNKTNTTASGTYLVTDRSEADGSVTYGAMTYLLGSTFHQHTTNSDGSLKNIQYYYMMSTYNATNEKLSVAYGNFLSGASVRCVKNN